VVVVVVTRPRRFIYVKPGLLVNRPVYIYLSIQARHGHAMVNNGATTAARFAEMITHAHTHTRTTTPQ
jgi:hypothetical protein